MIFVIQILDRLFQLKLNQFLNKFKIIWKKILRSPEMLVLILRSLNKMINNHNNNNNYNNNNLIKNQKLLIIRLLKNLLKIKLNNHNKIIVIISILNCLKDHLEIYLKMIQGKFINLLRFVLGLVNLDFLELLKEFQLI